MNKNIVKLIAILVMCFVIGAVLVACEGPQGPQGEPGKDGAASTVPGPQGPAGNDGKDATLTVDADGYIWANGVNTGIKVDISEENEICDDEHQFVAETWKEHTISSKGIDIAFCVDCGYAEWQVVDHVYDVVKTTPATCTADGKVEYFCECGLINESKTEVLTKLGHDYVPFDENNIDPTWSLAEPKAGLEPCLEQEVYITNCTRCDLEIEALTSATGHNFGDDTRWELAEPNKDVCACLCEPVWVRTCLNEGCKTEDHKYGAPTGHAWGDWTILVKPTATTAGSAARECANNCTFHTGHCVETIVLPALNDQDYTVTTVAATCGAEGSKTYTFKAQNLGETFTVVVEKTAHNYTGATVTVTTAPTATAAGKATVKCNDCDHVETVVLGDLTTATSYKAGNCDKPVDTYEYKFTLNGTELVATVLVNANYNHLITLPNELIVEGDYYFYTVKYCDTCDTWVVVHAEPKA